MATTACKIACSKLLQAVAICDGLDKTHTMHRAGIVHSVNIGYTPLHAIAKSAGLCVCVCVSVGKTKRLSGFGCRLGS